MKRLTTDCDFDGIKTAVDFYISDEYDGLESSPIYFQDCWLRLVRHHSFPRKIIDALTVIYYQTQKTRNSFLDQIMRSFKQESIKTLPNKLISLKNGLSEQLKQEFIEIKKLDSSLKTIMNRCLLPQNKEKSNFNYALGCMYAKGISVVKNEEKAQSYFEKSVLLGHIFAHRELAILTLNSDHKINLIPIQHRSKLKEKYHLMLKAAAAGDVHSWYNLAVGLDTDQRCKNILIELAEEYKQKVAQLRQSIKIDGEIITLLAFITMVLDPRQLMGSTGIIELYEQATALDYPASYYQLGWIYKNVYKIPEAEAKSMPFFKKAAELGNLYAQKELAFAYKRGDLLNKNLPESFKWFKNAADQGDAEACREVAYLYLTLKEKLSSLDYVHNAEYYFLMGVICDQSSEPHHYDHLAQFYESSLMDDLSLSYQWYLHSVQKNCSAFAMYKLGKIYEKGLLFAKDIKKAFLWYELSAQYGGDDAEISLAYFYEKGIYVKKELSEAIKIYNKYPENLSALYRLARLYEQGAEVKKDAGKASQLYNQVRKLIEKMIIGCNSLAEEGNALYYSGLLYQYGKGGHLKNLERAKDCYNMVKLSYFCPNLEQISICLSEIDKELSILTNLDTLCDSESKIEKYTSEHVETKFRKLFVSTLPVKNENSSPEQIIFYQTFFPLFSNDSKNETANKKILNLFRKADDLKRKKIIHTLFSSKPVNGQNIAFKKLTEIAPECFLQVFIDYLKNGEKEAAVNFILSEPNFFLCNYSKFILENKEFFIVIAIFDHLEKIYNKMLIHSREKENLKSVEELVGKKIVIFHEILSHSTQLHLFKKPKIDLAQKQKILDIINKKFTFKRDIEDLKNNKELKYQHDKLKRPVLSQTGEIRFNLAVPAREVKQIKLLKSGAYGSVYEGLWNGLKVAIKRLNTQNFTNEMMEDLENEVITLFQAGQLSEYVIKIKKICLEPGSYSLLMEFMDGGNLYDLLHSGKRLPWNLLLQIAIDVTRGLKDLHATNILHLDIKSLNILLNTNFRAKIGDLGSSKVYQKSQQNENTEFSIPIRGTVPWMAPEALAGSSEVFYPADIYSFGMVLWEMVTCKIPYSGQAIEKIKEKILAGEQENIPENNCPANLKPIIQSCWEFKPEKRLTAIELEQQLENILELVEKPKILAEELKNSLPDSSESEKILVKKSKIDTEITQPGLPLKLSENSQSFLPSINNKKELNHKTDRVFVALFPST